MDYVKFDYGFMFKYSERPNTKAARKFEDDVPEEVKSERLAEIIKVQRVEALKRTSGLVGRIYKVIVAGPSKKNPEEYCGRTTHNTMVIFPKGDAEVGKYVNVKTTDCTSITLFGTITTEKADA